MIKKYVIKILLITLSLIFIIQCSGDEEKTDFETALLSMVDADDSISLDGFSDVDASGQLYFDEEDDNLLGRTSEDEPYELPIRWIRRGISFEGTIDIEPYEDTDDTVYVQIQRHIAGTLFIMNGDTQIVSGEIVFTPTDTTEKPFEMDSQRRVRFTRIGVAGDNMRDWRISGVTPVVCMSSESTVDINNVNIELADIEMGVDFYIPHFEINTTDGILDMFFSRDDWPQFTVGEIVRTRISVSNTNPDVDLYPESGECVFMHYKRHPLNKGRRRLFDDGSTLNFNGLVSHDITENDNEFTRLWRIHGVNPNGENRHCRLFFDVIDYETLLDPSGEYHAWMIGLPYFVNE